MKKNISIFAVLLAALISTGCLITATANVPRDKVRHETMVRVAEPPTFVVDDDSNLVVVPGTYVYWLDGQDDVFFYGGVWWRQWDGYWYRADIHSGPWGRIEMGYVPQPVRHLPPNWRARYNEAPHVYWQDTRTQWHAWQNDRYWEKQQWKKLPPKKRPPRNVVPFKN